MKFTAPEDYVIEVGFGEIVVFTDGVAIVPKRTGIKLRRFAQRHPEYGIVVAGSDVPDTNVYVRVDSAIADGAYLVWDQETEEAVAGTAPTASVTSVNEQTGAVVLDKSDVGLDQADNTADADKPISDDTQAALDGKVDTSALVLNATDYGLVGDGATGNDLTELNAAIDAIDRPCSVYFPPGTYLLTTPLLGRSYVTYFGDTMGYDGSSVTRAVLKWTTGSALVPDPTQTLAGITFRDLCLTAAGDHLIDTTGTTGGLIFFRAVRCHIELMATDASVLKTAATNSNLFDIKFDGCKIERTSTHTVPAFDIQASMGISHITLTGGWCHSHGCTSTPFFKTDYTSNGFGAYAFEFRNLIGEQNAGGFIHLTGCVGVIVENVVDTDQSQAGDYMADVFYFGAGSGGKAAQGVRFVDSGVTDGTLNGTFAHLHIASGHNHYVGTVLDPDEAPVVVTPINGRLFEHDGGWARSLRTANSDYTVLPTDDVVMLTGGSHTFTLPDPTSLPYGRAYALKNNTLGSVLTVATAGTGQVDGGTTATLAAGESATYISNGTNWYALG